jgi:hypothetical protein
LRIAGQGWIRFGAAFRRVWLWAGLRHCCCHPQSNPGTWTLRPPRQTLRTDTSSELGGGLAIKTDRLRISGINGPTRSFAVWIKAFTKARQEIHQSLRRPNADHPLDCVRLLPVPTFPVSAFNRAVPLALYFWMAQSKQKASSQNTNPKSGDTGSPPIAPCRRFHSSRSVPTTLDHPKKYPSSHETFFYFVRLLS